MLDIEISSIILIICFIFIANYISCKYNYNKGYKNGYMDCNKLHGTAWDKELEGNDENN